jgi:hypothetical protein
MEHIADDIKSLLLVLMIHASLLYDNGLAMPYEFELLA